MNEKNDVKSSYCIIKMNDNCRFTHAHAKRNKQNQLRDHKTMHDLNIFRHRKDQQIMKIFALRGR